MIRNKILRSLPPPTELKAQYSEMAKQNLFNVDWLADYQAKRQTQGNERVKKASPARVSAEAHAAKLARQNESPHYIALQFLANHPEKLKGNQEHYAQVNIFWHYESTAPEIYKRLHSTPNGGLRHTATAGKMKAEGQKRGYPDMSYDKPRGIYCGMRIELKYGKNSLSEEQIEWLNQLSDDGYYCVVCYGEKEAIDAINAYDRLDDFGEMPAHINDPKWKKNRSLTAIKKR